MERKNELSEFADEKQKLIEFKFWVVQFGFMNKTKPQNELKRCCI